MSDQAPLPRRRGVLGFVLLLIALPPVVALGSAIRFYAANASNGTLVSGGRTREYLLHVPAGYDARHPVPLVISLHGAAMWPAAQMRTSGWNQVADEQGFLVVYPSGLAHHGPRVWRAEGPEGGVDDVRFIADLIDTLAARYPIDPARIYVNGFSNGGGLAFLLSCTLGDRLAAVGVVGAALFLRWDQCADPRPVPLIAFHGTADRAAPYHGGASWVAPAFPDMPRWVAAWARRNQCAPTPADTGVALDVRRRVYGACADGADVAFYTIAGGGHTWPGGRPFPEWFVGRTTTSISASRLMWEFFRAHPLGPR